MGGAEPVVSRIGTLTRFAARRSYKEAGAELELGVPREGYGAGS